MLWLPDGGHGYKALGNGLGRNLGKCGDVTEKGPLKCFKWSQAGGYGVNSRVQTVCSNKDRKESTREVFSGDKSCLELDRRFSVWYCGKELVSNLPTSWTLLEGKFKDDRLI